jgi:hypothetical protein
VGTTIARLSDLVKPLFFCGWASRCCIERGWASMATARDRHYYTRSARLVTGLVVAAALPQPCKKMTPTLFLLSCPLPMKYPLTASHVMVYTFIMKVKIILIIRVA